MKVDYVIKDFDVYRLFFSVRKQWWILDGVCS